MKKQNIQPKQGDLFYVSEEFADVASSSYAKKPRFAHFDIELNKKDPLIFIDHAPRAWNREHSGDWYIMLTTQGKEIIIENNEVKHSSLIRSKTEKAKLAQGALETLVADVKSKLPVIEALKKEIEAL